MGLISVVLLASGSGARMGADKLALPIHGRSLLAWTLAAWNALPERVSRLLVVAPGRALPPEAAGWRVVENPRAGEGMGASLAEGVAASHADSAAYLLGLGDQPALQAATIAALIAAWRSAGVALLRPQWRGQPGHPVLADGRLRAELLACAGDEGARALFQRRGSLLLPVEDPGTVLDVDRPADLDRLEPQGAGLRWRLAAAGLRR